jgi:hypothetical protein
VSARNREEALQLQEQGIDQKNEGLKEFARGERGKANKLTH